MRSFAYTGLEGTIVIPESTKVVEDAVFDTTNIEKFYIFGKC